MVTRRVSHVGDYTVWRLGLGFDVGWGPSRTNREISSFRWGWSIEAFHLSDAIYIRSIGVFWVWYVDGFAVDCSQKGRVSQLMLEGYFVCFQS